MSAAKTSSRRPAANADTSRGATHDDSTVAVSGLKSPIVNEREADRRVGNSLYPQAGEVVGYFKGPEDDADPVDIGAAIADVGDKSKFAFDFDVYKRFTPRGSKRTLHQLAFRKDHPIPLGKLQRAAAESAADEADGGDEPDADADKD